jgi:hypothetical protein
MFTWLLQYYCTLIQYSYSIVTVFLQYCFSFVDSCQAPSIIYLLCLDDAASCVALCQTRESVFLNWKALCGPIVR